MLVALITFGFSLAQIVIEQHGVSSHNKFVFYVVAISLSSIPVMTQLVILIGELIRARGDSFKLLGQRMMINVLGQDAISLLLRQYRTTPLGDYPGAKGLWRRILYIGHAAAKFFGLLTFGDAFSAVYQIRSTSVALWMDDLSQSWHGCTKFPEEDFPAGEFERSIVIRDAILRYKFLPDPSGDSQRYRYKIWATGSNDSAVSKLYFQKFSKAEQFGCSVESARPAKLWCSRENAIEFWRTMEAFDDDTFFVIGSVQKVNDQKLVCLDLYHTVKSILMDGKKVNGRRLYGASYS